MVVTGCRLHATFWYSKNFLDLRKTLMEHTLAPPFRTCSSWHMDTWSHKRRPSDSFLGFLVLRSTRHDARDPRNAKVELWKGRFKWRRMLCQNSSIYTYMYIYGSVLRKCFKCTYLLLLLLFNQKDISYAYSATASLQCLYSLCISLKN